jgi:hypothetical protein
VFLDMTGLDVFVFIVIKSCTLKSSTVQEVAPGLDISSLRKVFRGFQLMTCLNTLDYLLQNTCVYL